MLRRASICLGMYGECRGECVNSTLHITIYTHVYRVRRRLFRAPHPGMPGVMGRMVIAQLAMGLVLCLGVALL